MPDILLKSLIKEALNQHVMVNHRHTAHKARTLVKELLQNENEKIFEDKTKKKDLELLETELEELLKYFTPEEPTPTH